MFYGRKLEANSHLFRHLLTERNVFFQLAVLVRDALVRVAEPETNQVFWRALLPQPGCAEPPECVGT